VASKGGHPDHPEWYFNLKAHPEIVLQDGTETFTVRARELSDDERAEWWPRCVAAFPPYGEYQLKTDRLIPVFALERR
jgi:deazaflavin-dependent oxidoreductase (nitroreductase family)